MLSSRRQAPAVGVRPYLTTDTTWGAELRVAITFTEVVPSDQFIIIV
jgi:hypothetical protein